MEHIKIVGKKIKSRDELWNKLKYINQVAVEKHGKDILNDEIMDSIDSDLYVLKLNRDVFIFDDGTSFIHDIDDNSVLIGNTLDENKNLITICYTLKTEDVTDMQTGISYFIKASLKDTHKLLKIERESNVLEELESNDDQSDYVVNLITYMDRNDVTKFDVYTAYVDEGEKVKVSEFKELHEKSGDVKRKVDVLRLTKKQYDMLNSITKD